MQYPKGQSQVIYIRKASDIRRPLGPDPTMHYVADEDFETVIRNTIDKSYREPDRVERNAFGNPKIVSLVWYMNKEEFTTKPKPKPKKSK